jgi:hypothetical protein
MALLNHAAKWIENSWKEVGASFNANHVPVVQFEVLNVDDVSYPFKNSGVSSWFLEKGVLVPNEEAKISRVPYIAFAIVETEQKLNVQVQWAGRCGYGFEIKFGQDGEVSNQKMLWVS